MVSAWHFGNTTVRNPMRIREGLIVVSNPILNGNIITEQQQSLLTDKLIEAGVTKSVLKKDFVGRKWRSCFHQLGFITPKFKSRLNPGEVDPVICGLSDEFPELGLSGLPYELTPSGRRMIEAETVKEQQECMLRALLAYEIPSVVEPRNGNEAFKPFVFILQVLKKLSTLDNSLGLSKAEMGIVQLSRDHSEVDSVVEKITRHRAERDAVSGRVAKRRVDKVLLERLSTLAGIKTISIDDYADVNSRYSRLTGLVSHKGKRLVITNNREAIVDAIITDGPNLLGKGLSNDYLVRLWKGSVLPTDNEATARNEIVRFRQLLFDSGVEEALITPIPDTEDVAQLNQVRIRLETLYQQVLEKKYAEEQSNEHQVRETLAYLKKIDKQRYDAVTYDIDIVDEPAYFEWAVWRAFLAINQLVNEPHLARRFKVDQDFLPMGCAPGGGPDLIFEFEDYVLVVEVTLTTSSRQEAAEGEPVRRHVAKEKAKFSSEIEKPVYGLFMARSIDNNTAETFRIGVWYNGDEVDFINIVPITLKQFIFMMEKYLVDRFDNNMFRTMLDSCLIPRNAHAPEWKKEIDKVVNQFIN